MRRLVLSLAAVTALLTMVEFSQAHDPDPDILEISEVKVIGEKPVAASSQQFIPDKEILLQPMGRPAQVLRLIPGFLTVEHSGGAGKADQYFLRGFDADHGTDVAFFVDNMPINLRTHGHGQGYTDLNFIIPETIQGIDVVKGTITQNSATSLRQAPFGSRLRGIERERGARSWRAVRYTALSVDVVAHQGQGTDVVCRRRLLHERTV